MSHVISTDGLTQDWLQPVLGAASSLSLQAPLHPAFCFVGPLAGSTTPAIPLGYPAYPLYLFRNCANKRLSVLKIN